MTIREKVALALRHARLEEDDVDVAITAFLEAAAEDGWHMRPDEATEEMAQQGKLEWWKHEGSVEDVYRAMHAAAPEFEWDK